MSSRFVRGREYYSPVRGQALVMLLFYVVIGLTLISVSIALSISNSLTTMQEEEGNHALEIAESGVENALLRIVRDLEYPGETLTVGDGSATVTVSGINTKTIQSVGIVNGFHRELEVVVTVNNGVITLVSWQEQ